MQLYVLFCFFDKAMNRFRESSCISSSDEESVEESDWHDSQLSDDDDDKVSNTTLKNSDHAPKKLPKKRGLNVATIVLQRELGRKFFHSTSKKDLLLRLLFNFSSEEQLYMKDRSRLVNIFRSLLKRRN